MTSSIHSLDEYLNNSKTKLFRDVLGTDSAKAKSELAQNFHDELVYVMQLMKDSSSRADINASLDFLDTMIDRYAGELNKLNGKSGRLSDKFSEMKSQISSARAVFEESKKVDEDVQIESYKSQF